jgi:hypothetical protein
MRLLLEDYIEDIDMNDVTNDEVTSTDDNEEIKDYDFRVLISILDETGIQKATRIAESIINKTHEISSYTITVFKSEEPVQNNMYSSDTPCLIIAFSLDVPFRSRVNAFRFIYGLLSTYRFIDRPFSELKPGQTAQYEMVYYRSQVIYSKPTQSFIYMRKLAENTLEKPKKSDNEKLRRISDIYRDLIALTYALTNNATAMADFILDLFDMKDDITDKLAKYCMRSPKLMKLSAGSKKFLDNHQVDVNALLSQQNNIVNIYMNNIDNMIFDVYQKGYQSTPFTVWNSGDSPMDDVRYALSKQKDVRLHNVAARYDSISYSYMGAGNVIISAYLFSQEIKKPDDTQCFFVMLICSWTQLDKMIQALKEILGEELPECLVKDIMKTVKDRY